MFSTSDERTITHEMPSDERTNNSEGGMCNNALCTGCIEETILRHSTGWNGNSTRVEMELRNKVCVITCQVSFNLVKGLLRLATRRGISTRISSFGCQAETAVDSVEMFYGEKG